MRLARPVLLLALLALAAPAGTQAFFSAPQTLSAAGQDARDPQVAVDQDGDAIFVWAARDGTTDCDGSGCSRIQARARSAAGVLSTVQTLSAAGQDAFSPQVAVDQDGDAAFAWRRRDGTTGCGGTGCFRIEARARSAPGILSATLTLSAPGQHAGEQQLAVDQDGDAVFVWSRRDETTSCTGVGCSRIQARARSAAGAMNITQTLSNPGQNAFSPQIAIDQDGDAVFTWRRRDGSTDCGGSGCNRIQSRARTAADVLSVTQTLSDAGQDARDPQVAVDQTGDAVFAWERLDGTTGCGGSACLRIQARARSPAGALSAVQTLSAAGRDAEAPQVAIDQDGDAIFVWERPDGTGCGGSGCIRVQALARSAAGVLGSTQLLSDPSQNARSPQVAVDQAGDAAFVWRALDGTTSCSTFGCFRIQARTRSVAGVLSATETLSAAGQSALVPAVAVDEDGDAVAVWARPDGTTDCGGVACNRIQAAVAIWSAPVTLSDPGQHADAAQVAVDQDGDAVFVWARNDGTFCGDTDCTVIQARTRSATGTLSATENLSAAGQEARDPQVAVDQDGDAVFVWARRDGTTDCGGSGCLRVQARARSAAGVLSAIETLSAAGQHAGEPQVGVDQDGDAVFAWARGDGTTDCNGFGCIRIQARARSAAGTLSAVQTLSAAGQSASSPEMAVDQDGDAVFGWERPDATTDCGGSACGRIQARARSAAGALSATQTLSAAGRDARTPEVAVDQAGDAVFAWERRDATTDCGGSGCLLIQARARSAAGTLSATQTLSDAGQSALVPQVAVDQAGDAVVVWERLDGSAQCGTGGCSRIQTRARSATGILGSVQTLSGAGQHALSPQVAVDQDGDAVFVWSRGDGTTDCGGSGCFRVQARARSAAGILRPVQTLSAAGRHAGFARVARNPDGDAVAVWQRSDETTGCAIGCVRIQAATSPP